MGEICRSPNHALGLGADTARPVPIKSSSSSCCRSACLFRDHWDIDYLQQRTFVAHVVCTLDTHCTLYTVHGAKVVRTPGHRPPAFSTADLSDTRRQQVGSSSNNGSFYNAVTLCCGKSCTDLSISLFRFPASVAAGWSVCEIRVDRDEAESSLSSLSLSLSLLSDTLGSLPIWCCSAQLNVSERNTYGVTNVS